MGIQAGNSKSAVKTGISHVGTCVGRCGRGIFSDQSYARIRRPVTGKSHVDCVPEGAEVAAVVEAVKR